MSKQMFRLHHAVDGYGKSRWRLSGDGFSRTYPAGTPLDTALDDTVEMLAHMTQAGEHVVLELPPELLPS